MTQPYLTFGIPTWNRKAQLEICIRSIAEQIKNVTSHHIRILVSDDCSTDGTKEMVDGLKMEYPLIIGYRCREKRTDYSDAFKDIFTIHDADWSWTFGDDDILEPTALATILKILPDTDCQMVHVAERSRASGTNGVYKGELFTLCNTFGWIDMTGFITGNIVRGDKLKAAGNSPRWPLYAKSAFVQSCALLEVLAYEQCALIDSPLVATQAEVMTTESGERWAADNIPGRYMLVVAALERMYEEKILTKQVSPTFFRYINSHLWDRHIANFVNDYFEHSGVWSEDSWASITNLATFINDPQVAQKVVADVEHSRGLTTLLTYMKMNVASLETELKAIKELHDESCFPYGYVLPKEMVK